MTDQHPITPPPELGAKWVAEIYGDPAIPLHPITLRLVERAAQWGADQELEATLAEVSFLAYRALADRVRAARRPKPSSLKEQALAVLEEAPGPDYPRAMTVLNAGQHALIRRALEALPDD
jgi:hypothetical protein